MKFPLFFPTLLAFCLIGCASLSGQTSFVTCTTAANPPIVRAEGITERIGDVLVSCNGGIPGSRISGNFSVFTAYPITNLVNGGNLAGVNLTYDAGAGPQPTVPATLLSPNSLAFNGVTFNLSPSGGVELRLSDLRINVTPFLTVASGVPNVPLVIYVSFNPGNVLSIPSAQFTVALPRRGLYAGNSSKLVCAPGGSPAPDNPGSFASFLTGGSVFASTRLTEGFADAFQTKTSYANLGASSGHRFLIRYTGFPKGARLFVPDVVAGSDTVLPTAGGDYGLTASGGRYAPSADGSLLLARVKAADANGVGGQPTYTPGTTGSGTVSFDAVSEVSVDSTGTGFAVYEVVDANNAVQESAQFPTFLVLAPSGTASSVVTDEKISFAPVSNGSTIPSFLAVDPPPDCSIVGDCNARYNPVLFVETTPLQFTIQSGAPYQVGYFIVNNRGGGVMRWTASIKFADPSAGVGWLKLFPDSGVNNATVRVDATPGLLQPGTYTATVVIDAGPLAGTQSVPVTMTTTAAPLLPAVASVVNAASFAKGPLVAGSLATLMGSRFNGKTVTVTLDGTPAQVLFSNDTQINLLVPDSLAGKSSAQLVVTVDGVSSSPQTVQLAAASPAIFAGGVLNLDYSPNSADNPASTAIQIYATGLSGPAPVYVQLDGQIYTPDYAGAAPGFPGVQQVNLVLPASASGTSPQLFICANVGQPVCSPPVKVYIK